LSICIAHRRVRRTPLMRFFVTNQSRRSHSLRVQPANDYMTVQFKPLKCAIDVSVHGAFGVWSWAALTSRFIARGVRHRKRSEHNSKTYRTP